MTSKREFEKLENENRDLHQRLVDTEVELSRKEDSLKVANLRKTELLGDLREYQHKLKDVKKQLEKSESAEMEAKALAHDAKLAVEHVETQLREQAMSHKSTINSFQLEIKNFKAKLLEKDEEHDRVVSQLQQKDDLLHSLKDEKTKFDRQGSARLANLNQALMQAKQTCSQLSEENESLKRKEIELLQRLEALEQKQLLINKKESPPCKSLRPEALCCTPVKSIVGPVRCATPVKPIPEETEVDTLLHDNSKLKQELQCLQTNFQLTSLKTQQLKQELKDKEKSVVELQSLFDQLVTEKEDLQQKLEAANTALANSTGCQLQERVRGAEMEKDMSNLKSQLKSVQEQNTDLQEKLQSELKHSMESQDIIERLDSQIKTLKEHNSKLEGELQSAYDRLQDVESKYLLLESAGDSHAELREQASAAITSYIEKLTHLEKEKDQLMGQLDKAQQSVELAHTQITTLEGINRGLQQSVNALKAENEVLLSKSNSVPQDQLSEFHGKVQQLTEKYEEMCSENKELCAAQEQSRTQIEELMTVCQHSQQEVSQNKDDVKRWQLKFEEEESKLLQAKEDFQKQLEQCSNLAQQVEQLKLELVSAQNAKAMYEGEVSTFMNRLEEVEQCNFELTSRLGDVENERSVVNSALMDNQARLNGVVKKLEVTELALLEKEAVLADLNCNIELMEGENATLLSQVTSLSEMVAARNAKIEALQTHLSTSESDAYEIVKRITELESSHGQFKAEKEALESEIKSLKQSLENASIQKKEAESTILSLKLEIQQLQVYNGSVESINDDLQSKVKTHIARCEELASEKMSVEQHEYDLAQELQVKSAALQSALEEVEFTKKVSEDAQKCLTTQVESLEAKYNELQEKCEQLCQEKSDAAAKMKGLQTVLEEQKFIVSELTSEKGLLADQLESSRAALGSMSDDLHTMKMKLEDAKASLQSTEKELLESKSNSESTKENMLLMSEQYEQLRETALTMLESESNGSRGDENAQATPKTKKLKSILKNSGGTLKPIENLVD